MMLKSLAIFLAVGSFCVGASAQTSIYIAASDSFQTSLTAALMKKQAPVAVVTDQKKADYTLQSSAADSTGAPCLGCSGAKGSSTVSMELVRNSDREVVWVYQARKAPNGPAAIQDLSETVAKRLKHDFLDKQPLGPAQDPFSRSWETP